MPPAVEAAFKKSYPNATIKNVSKEREGGRDEFQLTGAKVKEAVIASDGTFIPPK